MQPACPLCSGTKSRVIYTVTAAQSAQNWILEQNEPVRHAELAAHIASLWGRDFATANECQGCSFGFADPFVAGDARFYGLAFGPSNYPRDKWEFQKTLEAMRPLNLQGKALEIASGYGYFLEKVSPKYFSPKDVTSLEYNDVAIARLKESGYTTKSCDLQNLVDDGERYSAIFMYQILEHRDRIHDTFDALSKLIVPGGSIFIAVPNPPSVRFWEENNALLDVPPNHIGFWKPQNLADMAQRYGLEVKEMALEPFSILTFMKWDTFFSYTKRAHLGQFPASQLYSNRRSGIGRYANLLALIAYSPLRLPIWIKAWRKQKDLAPHIWVHLTKP